MVPRSVVAHPEQDPLTVSPCSDLDLAIVLAVRDAVAERVLDERLQDEVRYHRLRHVLVHCPPDAQPVGEAHLFDLEILAREQQLLRQRDFVNVPRLEHASEHVAQARDQLHRDVRLSLPHQHRNRVERVEQEVRVELHPERLKLRARELPFERGRPPGILLVGPGEQEPVRAADQTEVDRHGDREPAEQPTRQERHVPFGRSVERDPVSERPHGCVNQARQGASQTVHEHRGAVERSSEWIPVREAEDERRHRGPGVPTGPLREQHAPEGGSGHAIDVVDVPLDDREGRRDAPENQNEASAPECVVVARDR